MLATRTKAAEHGDRGHSAASSARPARAPSPESGPGFAWAFGERGGGPGLSEADRTALFATPASGAARIQRSAAPGADGAAPRSADARGEPVRITPAAKSAHAAGAGVLVQRFESEEHKELGDTATGGAKYDLGGAGFKLELTHGDIVALSGDVFDPKMLFDLASKPGKNGQAVGTSDEVVWALKDDRIWEMRVADHGPYRGQKDPRFQPGGVFAKYTFSPEVQKTVYDRYRWLGAKNVGHFTSPWGRDAKNDPSAVPANMAPKGDRAAGTAQETTAGGNYHNLHQDALDLAYTAGKNKGNNSLPLAHEAAAQHFLTDAFSAGHVRTPIGEIRAYWGAKYPLFWYNLRHKISLDTALEMMSGVPLPNSLGYDSILERMREKAATIPPVTLGDLLGGVFHNVDNDGLKTAGGGAIKGDWVMDKTTKDLAIAAIKAGNLDVEKAFELGQSGQDLAKETLYAAVRSKTGATGATFAPENAIPKPDASLPQQNWYAPTIEELWDKPLLGAGGPTVGQTVFKQVQPGGSIYNLITGLATEFDETARGFHPRRAYLQGFRDPLVRDPKRGVLDVVHWAPHDMIGRGTTIDAVHELDEGGKKGQFVQENMSNLTFESRVKYLRNLVGVTAGGDAQDAVMRIFETMHALDRKKLYEAIEGHPWKGDFNRSLGSRDQLFITLNSDRVERLKRMIQAVGDFPTPAKDGPQRG